MRIIVRVKPRARVTRVAEMKPGTFSVAVTAPPEENKANMAVVEALARHFRVPPRTVSIRRGLASRTKIIEIRNHT